VVTGKEDANSEVEMERETRIELATNSLEGCDSTIELLPLFLFYSKTTALTESILDHDVHSIKSFLQWN
jgi:hypothetical protein